MSAPGEPVRIALGITGGIAAYKSPELVRLLQARGLDVTCILTEGGRNFVTPLVLQALSGRRVIESAWDLSAGRDIEHIALARSIRLLLVAPATANILAKMAHGIADDFLTTFFTATDAPTLVCPAMNQRMWSHLPVRENVARLRAIGVEVVEPEEGELACGEIGAGRLAPLAEIVERAAAIALPVEAAVRGSGDWSGEKVLVSAGPTAEDLDPVRFLTNASTGKMGYALAEEARRRGAQVTLVHGPTALPAPPGVRAVAVRSALEMRDAIHRALPGTTVLLMAAAVSDWRPERASAEKEKKSPGPVTITLVRTPDILLEIGERAVTLRPRPILVGFAAETSAIEEHALAKLRRKKLDLVCANRIGGERGGFGSEENACVLLDARGGRVEVPMSPKREVARRILDRIGEIREGGTS